MTIHRSFAVAALFLLIGASLADTAPAQPTQIEDIFKNPPESAQPRGYWLWPHGNYDYMRIEEELRAFKEMGLAGMDIYDMGIQDRLNQIPAGNIFLDENMLDGIAFASETAQDLGLKLGLSVSNGWNAGGPWTPPDERIMQLLFWKETVTGPANITEIGFPEVPHTFKKPYGTYDLYPEFDDQGFPVYYENVALVAYPSTEDGTIAAADVLHFDHTEIRGNRATVELPEGRWVLARAVVVPLGQRQWMRSDRSNGYIMDHYSKKATRNHFTYVIERLEERLGDLRETALERLYLASFEAEDYIIWSPELKETFYRQHDYEMDPYLPILAGQQIEDEAVVRRFLHDYRSTVSEMFIHNHYRQARDLSNAHGLLLASESGGPGLPLHYVPTEDLKALGSVDVMRGEFWNKKSEYFDENGNDLLQVVRNIASAAHIYGHRVVEMEAFTSHQKYWQESPLELKILADRAFAEGMTRVVYHTMPHSPKEAGEPGWSYGAGTHISPKMAWWQLSEPFHSYMARTSALLQAGRFVADVAYYYGEQVPKFASGSKFVRETLGPGYDYDDLNKEILLQSTVAPDGRVQLPSGMKYHLLVLPDDPEMSLDVIKKIEALLQQGATILGTPPATVPGLKDYRIREQELRRMVEQIWGTDVTRQKRTYGKGRIITGFPERDILLEKGIRPDFSYTHQGGRLDYIHRATEQEDIYFIRNIDSVAVQAVVDVRVKGRQPYIFDPVSGHITALAVFDQNGDRTHVPLALEPYGSTILVFRAGQPSRRHIVSYTVNDRPGFPQEVDGTLTVQHNEDGTVRLLADEAGIYRLSYSDGTTQTLELDGAAEPVVLNNPWSVHFPYGWGFEPIQQFDALIDWKDHPDPALSMYSGRASYKTSFTVDDPVDHYILDLGEVGVAARVYLNGKEVGTRVFPPYRFNVSHLVRAGENNLVVEVASTWLNRLVGDAGKPFSEQRTNSNLVNIVRTEAGETNFVRPWAGYSPQAAGLIGPVRLQVVPYVDISGN